jgi:thioredoxin-related protein
MDVKGDTPMVDFKGTDTTEKDFALKNRARATPTFLFFDTKGDMVTRYIGVTRDADEFLMLGRYVVDGVYKDKPFAAYKMQAQK